MLKIKRWLVFPLLIILILPFIFVPALAVASGLDAMSPILWSFVGNGDGITEFGGNYLTTNSNFILDSGIMTQVIDAGIDSCEVSFFADYTYRFLTLASLSCVVDLQTIDKMNSLYFRTEHQSNSFTVTCNFEIADMQLINNEWQAVHLGGSFTDNVAAGEWCQFGSLLAREIKRLVSTRYVVISTMSVTIAVGGDEFYNDQILMNYDVVSSLPSVVDYIGQYDMIYEAPDVIVDPANPNDVSFVDWLKVAVGGFLDFQLWPGFTLNQLIEFVVVIGLVLWFITLLI